MASRAEPSMELKGPGDEVLSTDESPSKCSGLQNCFHSCTRPCLAETHPLPPDASICRRFADSFLCPPHSRMGAIFFVILIGASGWATLYSMTGIQALPGGNLFALFILFMSCWVGGYCVQRFRLPPLLGMLIVGCVLGNAPDINVARDIEPEWSSGCRMIALTIILIRAGLGLDPKALRRLSFVVVRLAFLPCLTETLVDGIAAHLILGFPWPWAFMLGFVIAAVSPAVVVPSLLSLSDAGYGIDKGIPTLVIAAASIDDVLAITGFGVLLSISFSTGNIGGALLKGPLEAVIGVIYGIITGIICWYIPQKSSRNLVLFRSSLLLFFGLVAIFGFTKIELSGSGPLGALTLPFVAALRWRSEFKNGEKNPVENVVGVLWMIFQPLLFGLIGAQVDMSTLDGSIVGSGVAVLCIGLVFRIALSFIAVCGTNLNLKERLFIPFAWLPKATVQAAIGAVALDTAIEKKNDDFIALGKKVLMMAVLVILITAPLGSVGITLAGPRLLKRTPDNLVNEIEISVEEKQPDSTKENEDVEGQDLLQSNGE